MDFFDLARKPELRSVTSYRFPDYDVSYGVFAPTMNEKQKTNGSWEGYVDGNLYYDSDGLEQPRLDPFSDFPSAANLNILSVPQIAAFDAFTYVEAARVRSYIHNTSIIESVSTLADVAGVNERDIDDMPNRRRLILRPLQNINRIVSDQGLESATLDLTQKDILKNYISDSGYIMDRDELVSVIGAPTVKDLEVEGIFAAPPVNIHHFSPYELNEMNPAGNRLHQTIKDEIDKKSVIDDGFADLSQDLDGPSMLNMEQLNKMSVWFSGVININHEELTKEEFNAPLLEDVDGTNNTENNLQNTIEDEGFIFREGDIDLFLNEGSSKFFDIFQQVGLFVSGLEHFEHIQQSTLEDISYALNETPRKLYDSLQSAGSIHSESDIPDDVDQNSIIRALFGLVWPRKNINTLPKSELVDLPGLTSDDADRIITYRRKRGDITNRDEFKDALSQP